MLWTRRWPESVIYLYPEPHRDIQLTTVSQTGSYLLPQVMQKAQRIFRSFDTRLMVSKVSSLFVKLVKI